ncbi:MAG: hypothetical protein IKK89_02060 [Alistipes sp.]|nr:hypothetical protein [Alistipes sp.]
MEDLLYAEFDFSQYDPLANINAILEEIAQKNLEIEEVATEMEGFGNATPEKVAQIDIIEREIQEMKKRADYYLAHLTKLWHDRLWDVINLFGSDMTVENNTIRVELDSHRLSYVQIELNAINKCRYEYGLVSDDDSNNSESFGMPPYHQPLQCINNYGYVDLDKAYDLFTKLIEKLAYWITRSDCSSLYLS